MRSSNVKRFIFPNGKYSLKISADRFETNKVLYIEFQNFSTTLRLQHGFKNCFQLFIPLNTPIHIFGTADLSPHH